MTQWYIELAKQLSKHEDSISVIRHGRNAKRATRHRNRRIMKKEIKNGTMSIHS